MFKELSNKEAMELLKAEAKKLGITYSPNIGLKTLEEKLEQARILISISREEDTVKTETEVDNYALVASAAADKLQYTNVKNSMDKKLSKMQLKLKVMNRANRLIRCSVTCLDPSKKDTPGIIVGVRNSMIPLTKKYVPLDGRITHIPQIILDHLKEKECQTFHLVTDQITKEVTRRPKVSPMYSITVLPHLSSDDIEKLAKAQRAAGSIETVN